MRWRTASGSRVISTPRTLTDPAVGCITPVRSRMVVVLPAPSGPTRPKISPGGIDTPSRSTAVRLPNCLVRSLASTAGILSVDAIRLPTSGFLPLPDASLWQAGAARCPGYRVSSGCGAPWLQGEFRIRRHPRLQLSLRVLDRDLDRVYEIHPLLGGLHVLGCELSLVGNPGHRALKGLVGKTVHQDPGGRAQPDLPQLGFEIGR